QEAVVLSEDILLNRTARAAEADGVTRRAVHIDEMPFHHQSGLLGETQIELDSRFVGRRGRDGISLTQQRRKNQALAAGQAAVPQRRALLVPDADSAAWPVDELAVPRGLVERGGTRARLREGREH